MKKKISQIGKKVFVLFLIALMNVNTYATTQSFDGSAFVTKAEFDRMLNDFNEQMNIYQSDLNAKIDSAIAGYISGVSGTKISKKDIFFSTWDTVQSMNGVVDPSFEVPNVNILIAGGISNTYSWDSNKFNKWYAQPIVVRLVYSGATGKGRPLVTNKGTEASGGGNSYWGGIASLYRETYTINAGVYSNTSTDMASVESSGSATYQFENSTRIVVSDGYNSGFATANSVMNPAIKWKGPGTSYYNTVNFGTRSVSSTAEVELVPLSSGKTTYWDHIIQYSGDSEWWVSNPNFTKTFMKHSKNGNKAATILTKVTKTNNISSIAIAFDNAGSNYGKSRYNVSADYTTPNNDIIPSIGMFKEAKKAKNIYFTSEEVKYKTGNTTTTLAETTLEKGFPLFYAETDTEIEWKPRFTSGQKWDTTNNKWVAADWTRVKLLLAVGTFSDKIASTDIIKATSATGTTTDGGVLCTIGTNESVKFKMPKNGVVYAKWVPDTASYDTDKWLQPLQVSLCGSYYESK